MNRRTLREKIEADALRRFVEGIWEPTSAPAPIPPPDSAPGIAAELRVAEETFDLWGLLGTLPVVPVFLPGLRRSIERDLTLETDVQALAFQFPEATRKQVAEIAAMNTRLHSHALKAGTQLVLLGLELWRKRNRAGRRERRPAGRV